MKKPAGQFAPSGNEARRIIQQGGVEIDGMKTEDPAQTIKLAPGTALLFKVGKRKYLKIMPAD